MKNTKRLFTLVTVLLIGILLTSCSKTTENEHLPEYCRTYSGFMEFASEDLYNLVGGINRDNYLSVISSNEEVFYGYDSEGDIDLDGIQCFQNLTSLTLDGPGFKDISEINALKNIQHISLINTNVVNISSFKNLSKVNQLTISNTKTLQSVDGIEEMTKLTYLDLSDNGIVNIDGLNNLINLDTLILSNNEITFFPSINNLYKLETLDVSNNNIIQLGDDLSGLVNLVNFDASNNQICDLSTLDDLESLVTLNLGDNNLGCNGESPDFSALESAANLTTLILNNNGLTSISDLDGRDLPLEELQLQENLISDISPIRNFTELKRLDAYDNHIINIDDLSGMINLTRIDLSKNDIIDFSGLRTIPDLDVINLSSNQITFIPDISDSWPSLRELNLHNNVITDTSGVEGHPNLRTLILSDNLLTELSGISNLPLLSELVLYHEPDESELETYDPFSKANVISTLRNSYNNNPVLSIVTQGYLDLGYEFGGNVRILGSINDNEYIQGVILSGIGIIEIDEFSFNLENLSGIDVSDNGITDITFLMGNPNLKQIDVSGNNVSNLTIINGTNSDDFDNLEQINAKNITGVNNLDGAFIDLPDLNFIDLTGTTLYSINNSFNNLDELTTLRLTGEALTTIENSFNNIFASSSSDNDIILLNGNLYSIIDSFNVGNYNVIGITTHINNSGEPSLIENSFNDLNVNGIQGITISGNEFNTVTNSFNRVVVDNLFLANNVIEVITGSFEESNISIELNLQNNELSTLDLSLIENVRTLDLANNALTTVSFLDGVPGLIDLDISSQLTFDGSSFTLFGIDGINNMPLLTNITFDNIPIQTIDGFKDIGITTFNYNLETNNDIYITNITNNSFSNSLITELDLGAYELSNIDFLGNFGLLETLYLGVNMLDLSQLSGSVFEDTLSYLEITNASNIADFTVFEGYDQVVDFTLDSPNTLVINNFNGLDSVESIVFVQEDLITEFNNSFNEFASFAITENYLSEYANLTNVTNSFDIYGLNGTYESVQLVSSIAVVGSFNNAKEATIINGVEIAPTFDLTSFDTVEIFGFTNPLYSSYAFMTNYPTLNEVGFGQLTVDITDFENSNVVNVSVSGISNTVNQISVLIDQTGLINIQKTNVQPLTIDTNTEFVNISVLSSNIQLNATNPVLRISGTMGNLEVNGNDITDVYLESFSSQSGTFNTNSLSTVVSGSISGSDFTSLVVNTLEPSIDFTLRTANLSINDSNSSDITLYAPISNVILNTSTTDIVGEIQALDFDLTNNLLETINLTNSTVNINLISTNLNSVILNTSNVATLDINSDSTSLIVTGSNIDTVSVLVPFLTNGTFTAPNSSLTIDTLTATNIDLNVTSDTATIDGTNVTGLTFNNDSDVNTLDLLSTPSISSLIFGTSTIDSISLESNENSVSISGTHSMDIALNTPLMSNLIVDTPNSNLDIYTNVSTLNTTMNANDVTMDGLLSLTDLIVDTSSSIHDVTITNSNLLSSMVFGNATVNKVTTSTTDTSYLFNGVNVTELILTGNSIISLDVVNDSIFTFNSTSSGSLSIDVQSTTVSLNTRNNIVSFNSDSVSESVSIDSNNLFMLLLANANITNLDVASISSTLTLSGTQVDNVVLDTMATGLSATLPLLTTLNVTTNALTGGTFSTTTSNIEVASIRKVTLNSSNLDSATVSNGLNDVDLNITTPAVDFTLSGNMGDTLINSSSMNTIGFGTNTTISELTVANDVINTLDFTNVTIPSLIMNGNISSLTVSSTTLTSILLNTDNLNYISGTTPNAEYTINTNQNNLDLDGSAANVVIVGLNLSSLDFIGFTTNEVDITSNNLAVLDTVNQLDTLIVTSPLDDFDLTSNTQNLIFNSGQNNNLILTSSIAEMNITTTVDSIDINSPTTTYKISGTNLNSITGTINDLDLIELLGNGSITLDIDANDILIDNDLITSVLLMGTRTVGTLEVRSTTVNLIATNDVSLQSLYSRTEGSTVSIDTLASVITTGATTLDSVILNIRTNGQTIFSNADDITLNTTNNSSTTLNVTTNNSLPMVLTANNINVLTLNYVGPILNSLGDNTLSIDGDVTSLLLQTEYLQVLNIQGIMNNVDITDVTTNYIATLDSTNLFVNDTFILSDTLIDDLSFVSTQLLGSVLVIDVNTLDINNIDTIISTLTGTGINLVSSVLITDIYDYFYGIKLIELTDLETTTPNRFDAYYAIERIQALDTIRLNGYFDYLSNTTLNNQIDAQTYLTAQEYLDGYAVSLGLGYTDSADMVADTVNYGQTAVDDIRTSIESTLNDPELIIDTTIIDSQVTIDIETDADLYATNERDTIGFTLN